MSRGVRHIPRWLPPAAAVVAGVACFVLAIVALVVLVRRQWRDARNAAAAGLAGAATAIIASIVWRAGHGAIEHAVLHGSNPSIFVVDTAFVAFVVGTDLARRSRWSRWWAWSGAALLLSGLAAGTLTPFAVVLALFGGLLVGWVVRWLLGAASVLPTTAELTDWLTSQGVHGRGPVGRRTPGARADWKARWPTAAGSAFTCPAATPAGRARPGGCGRWSVSGRRSRGTSRSLPAPGSSSSHWPASWRSGPACPAPRWCCSARCPARRWCSSRRIPDGRPGVEGASPAGAASLFASLRRLHDTGVAHHDLQPDNVFISGNCAGFCSLDAAEPGASELARRLDLVQALTTLARAVGPAAAVAALRAGYGPVDRAAVAAVTQPIALAPWGWRAMRAASGCLDEIRHELLGDRAALPTPRLERFRWRTIVTAVALTVAGYLLVGQLSGVNLLSTLSQANPAWFALAVLGSAVTYLAAAENLAAFVPKRLSIWRGFRVQLATAFVGVALPPTVGHVAVNARYLHHEEVDDGTIAAAVTMSQIVNVVTTVLLLIVLGVLTGSGFSRFKIAPGADVLIGLLVILAIVIVLLAVPQTRAKLTGTVWPHLRAVWPRLLDAISHPVRLAISAAANVLLSIAYLVAMLAALWSVGAHPPILATAVVYLAGNAVGSAAPTPGGIGGVEAVLAAGLTAIGIPAHQAIAAVLIFRTATFWLPIPVGWISYLELRRRGIL